MKYLLFPVACATLAFSGCRSDVASHTAENDSAYARLSEDEQRLPKHALAGLDVAEGMEATLFASEPMMGNPTNIDVDARGRVWVCEAFNYRNELNPDNPERAEGDRILILEDTNGDGRADTSKVFYQGTDVNAALGIAVFGNKVIVSCSPNVFVFTDTNGDDRPDKKELLFTHVGGEQHDHAIHAFTFGPDGRYYFNFGNEGQQLMDKHGKVLTDKDGVAVTDKGAPYRMGMVFRINPDGTGLEVLGHNFRNNYEADTDAFGTVWQSDNDDDGNQSTRINYVMEYGNYGYTDELTGAGWRARRTNMEAEIPKRHWHQNDPGSIPNLLFTGAGSPAGLTVYEGSLLPEAFRNQVIHCDAGNNIVRAYPVQKSGAGYTAEIRPLLTGTRDQWFRPIDVCAAPDGSLFVADWYDPGVGGHQMGDLNRGRIYRLTPKGNTGYKVKPAAVTTPEGAVQALLNPNGATRYLGWTALHAMGAQAEPVLQPLFAGKDARQRARALWLLARIPGKGETYLQQALKDGDADIRITGLRAARQLRPEIMPYLKALAADKDPAVRREVALALRHNRSAEAAAVWTELALQYDGKDRWYLEALGIGADGQWDAFLDAWMARAGDNVKQPAGRDILWRARSGKALPHLAAGITDASVGNNDRAKYFRAFDFIKDPSKEAVLLALLEDGGPKSKEIQTLALNHLSPEALARSPKAKAVLNEILASVQGTQDFLDLTGRYGLKNQNDHLFQMALQFSDSSLGEEAAGLLLKSGGAPLFRKAIAQNDARSAQVMKVLGGAGSHEAVVLMLGLIRDPGVPMPLREEAVKSLAAGWGESERLLELIKARQLPKELEPTAAVALGSTYRKDIRQEALKYLNTGAARSGTLPPISDLAKRTGKAEAGRPVFQRSCATCHKVGGDGAAFGPALTLIGSKLTKEALYLAIIHPDAGISFGYEGVVFRMKDGSQMAGIISSETDDTVELLLPGGSKKQLDKREIQSRKRMENSMMPSGLQQSMTQQELVDLVEYLHAQKK
ncbi:MAG TPA: PVC-type heme-binding CxxCH protein, partial [Chitinophagaceae bacterium]|nr:PVC-type heme-binding CxxCH protein [Chitinophagaceae bacterium]